MFYEYKCDKCGEEREEQHGMLEAPVVLCPVCNEVMRKVITGGGAVIYKGTDFYCKSHGKAGAWGD